ncbi:MAG: hypothetical protein E7314_02930 [Clostridiales bacterium]|nr:hypothetical protein [Clostridiales bacterium]
MKKEKGSALLTVILIIFVTVTIGTALSSLIVYNYRLRALDNKIARAEYQTEILVDKLQVDMKVAIKEMIEDAKKEASYKVRERQLVGEFKLLDGSDLEKRKAEAWAEEFWVYINDNYGDKFSKIYDKYKIVRKESVVEDSEDQEIYKRIVEKLVITTKYDNTPTVSFSLNFIFNVPRNSSTVNGDYDIDQWVGITNFTMQDRGYL